MTVEEKALLWARKQKGNVLNNKNVDCFIEGYNMAAKEYKEVIDNGYKDVLTKLSDKLEKQLDKSNSVIPDLVNKINHLQSDLLDKEKENEHMKSKLSIDDKDKIIQIQNSKIENLERELKEMKGIFLQKGIKFEKEIKDCKNEITKKDTVIKQLQAELEKHQKNV